MACEYGRFALVAVVGLLAVKSPVIAQESPNRKPPQATTRPMRKYRWTISR